MTDKEERQQPSLAHIIVDSVQPPAKNKKPPPVFDKKEEVPILSERSCHIFILLHASWPVVLDTGLTALAGEPTWAWLPRLVLYTFAFVNMMLREAKLLLRLGKRVGFLDGDKHARDRVPENDVHKTLFSVVFFATVRPAVILAVPYCIPGSPQGVRWVPLFIGLCLYPIIVDLWFYTYHRACHEVSFLWKFHRTHHLTKHPIPLLASYSDFAQEIIEVILVPLAAYLNMGMLRVPLSFHEWWICQAYILFEEIMGHSGLRVYAVAPALSSPLLRLLKSELVIEDHDLHHRRGWRQSYNYGKQTRLWDRLLGTTAPRLESDNVNFRAYVHMPCF